MKYKEITTVEKAFEMHPDKVDHQRVVDALAFLPKELSSGMISVLELQVATYVVNNIDKGLSREARWIANYNDNNQEKWAPWYIGGDTSGVGFRFRDSDVGWTYSSTTGGARLALIDEPRANHMNDHFQPQYKNFYLILD